jgi:hypothetical protein
MNWLPVLEPEPVDHEQIEGEMLGRSKGRFGPRIGRLLNDQRKPRHWAGG